MQSVFHVSSGTKSFMRTGVDPQCRSPNNYSENGTARCRACRTTCHISGTCRFNHTLLFAVKGTGRLLVGRACSRNNTCGNGQMVFWVEARQRHVCQPASQPTEGKTKPLQTHAQPATPSAVCTIQSISHREPGTTTAVILAHTAKLLFANGSGNDRGVAVGTL